jgi:hypothetical protein
MQIFKKKFQGLPVLLIIAGLVSFGYVLFSVSQNVDLKQTANQVFQAVQQNPSFLSNEAEVEPKIENNQSAIKQGEANSIISSYEFTAASSGETPFSLLNDSEKVEYDEYDFGVFVTSINGQASNNDNFWAVYVNGELAQQASDQIELDVGDRVEWRWEEIQDELLDN